MSATTMVFLSSDHVLERTVTVANVTRLTMHVWRVFLRQHIGTVVRNGQLASDTEI